MRKAVISLVISVLAGISTFAQEPSRTGSFSLAVGPTLSSYSTIDDEDGIYGTQYVGFRIEPDWNFSKHFGLRVSLGNSWSFSANATGEWERSLYSVFNTDLAVIPYYEFPFDKWYIDLGAVLGGRIRLPFLNGEPSKYLMTLSACVGANLRVGYDFTEKWGWFVEAGARRTVYDYLYNYYHPSGDLPVSGFITTSFGICYNF